MNLEEFTKEANRTEVHLDKININYVLFEELQKITIRVVDCLDLIKKNVFYGKEIDAERVLGNMDEAIKTANVLRMQINANPNFLKHADEAEINPREFHGMLGMITEASEMLELISLRDNKNDKLKIIDELGDMFWYVAILADEKELDIEEQVLNAVIAKLRKRFPDKFEAALAVSRDKDAELEETARVSKQENKSKPVDLKDITPNIVKKETRKKRATRKKPVITEGKTKTNVKELSDDTKRPSAPPPAVKPRKKRKSKKNEDK